jgi:hypothetical protein
MSLFSRVQDVKVIKTVANNTTERMFENFMAPCVKECLGKFRLHLPSSTDDCARSR